MNREIAQRWVAALKSGDYIQGRERLRSTGDLFCCLGVLCDLAVRDGIVGEWRLRSTFYAIQDPVDADILDGGVLPGAVRDWAGMHSQSGRISASSVGESLIDMNDQERMSFEEIADYISANMDLL